MSGPNLTAHRVAGRPLPAGPGKPEPPPAGGAKDSPKLTWLPQMISNNMMSSLRTRIEQNLHMTFDRWKQKYPTASEILCDANGFEINGTPIMDLRNVTARMYLLAGQYRWTWHSGAGADLLEKGLERGTKYDCHSISRALGKLCWLLGYSRSHSYEDCIKKFQEGGDVYHLKYDNGDTAVVLPKYHLNSRERLTMPDGSIGEDSCDGHFVWTDHQFVVIDNRVYDAMLEVAGIEQAQIGNENKQGQYVEWLGEVRYDKGAPNGFYWKANKKDKSNIFLVNGEKTFEDPRKKQLRFSRSAPFIKSIGGNQARPFSESVPE